MTTTLPITPPTLTPPVPSSGFGPPQTNNNKIYIARNHGGYTVSIVIAPRKRDAELFWQGKSIIPFSVEEIDPDSIDTPLGILEILKTRVVKNGWPKIDDIIAVDKN
jgi:hypothetical protein